MTTTDSAAQGAAAALTATPPMRADARRSHDRLIAAATEAFAQKGADAPLEDIAKRAGVGIGTLYRHFPARLDLQEAVYRNQVSAVCQQGAALAEAPSPGEAFAGWLQALSGYLVTKRGLASALIEAKGKDSEVISTCSQIMRSTAERLLQRAQDAGAVRPDVTTADVMMLVHGVVVAAERAPEQTDRLLSITLDGLRAKS
ncbi:MAG TPA: helix-turn-helix domain-containing protein [Streptosporangiaceae bacterium]|jgi:AcrR family transcriptional regulator|nr:helix-turn-helix domain-containing protein [Streptosporangiaceae bacterium]